MQEIKSIRAIGEKQTYDLVVPDYNNYILSNGVITHNSGKSTLGATLAYYLDHNFSLDNIVFTQDQLMYAIDNSKKKTAILFDEAAMAALAQDAATTMQTILIKKFVTIRKKQLYIILVIPSIFLLRKYFAIFRAKACLHTYTPDGITRGHFKFYSYNKKRLLFIRGLKEFNQDCVKPDFIGDFTDTEGMFYHPEAYDIKKEATIKQLSKFEEDKKYKKTKTQLRYQNERDAFLYICYQLSKATHSDAMTKTAFKKLLLEEYDFKRTAQSITTGLENGQKYLDALREKAKYLEQI